MTRAPAAARPPWAYLFASSLAMAACQPETFRLARRICFLLLLAARAETQALRELPLCTRSLAQAGGGLNGFSGADALFANPAALPASHRHQVEMGLLNLSSGFSGYSLYGRRTGEESAYALGGFRDERSGGKANGPDYGGVLAGFAVGPPDWLSAGLALASHMDFSRLGVDMHAGLRFRPRPGWEMGAAVRHALRSGLGQDPDRLKSHRHLWLSLGLSPAALGKSFADWPGKVQYDLLMEDLPQSRFAHVFSMEADLLPEKSVGLTAGYRLPHFAKDESPRLGAGLTLGYPLRKILLQFRYAVGLNPDGHASMHSLSVTLNLFRHADPELSGVAVRLDRPRVGALKGDPVHFHLLVDARRNWQSWELVLCAADAKGRPRDTVRVFSGRELPPRNIRWEGTDSSGNPLREGLYAFRIVVRDNLGREENTRWQLLEISADSPRQEPAPD